MKLEKFILIPLILLCISAKGAKESCSGRCGIFDNSKPVCQCNTACIEHSDCCDDYEESCPKEFCVDSCGQPYNKTHRCQCNTDCKQYNNCCDDYGDFCLLGVNESSTTEYTKYDTPFTAPELHGKSTSRSTTSHSKDTEFYEESTSRSTTSLNKDTVFVKTGTKESSSGIIAGVAVSLTFVMLIVVVILVLVFRKIHLRKQLLSQTEGKGKRTSKMNYYVTDNVQEDQYHDIDISNGDYCLAAALSDETANIEGNEDGDTTYVRAISGVYDELNGKDKRKIPTKYQNENTSKLERSKSGIYTVTSNQTVNQHTKDNNSTKWQTPDAEDFDPTYNHSNNVTVREDLSNYDHFSNQ